MKDVYLICDCVGYTQQIICEAKESNSGRITFRGPFTECERANRNKRIYPETVMKPEFDRLSAIAESGRLLGELDHPDDSIIHLKNTSHQINNLWWEKKHVGYGECTTLKTPAGLVLEALFHDGVPVGVSSRGVGTGQKNEQDLTIIKPGFKLITWDAVADPSYQEAWQEIVENVSSSKTTVSMATPKIMTQENCILDKASKVKEFSEALRSYCSEIV